VSQIIRSDGPAAIERLFRRHLEDPVAFCFDMFPEGERPRPQQQEILAGVWENKQSLVVAHRGFGKSRTAAYALLAFLVPRANSLVMTLAPIWEQVTGGVWVDVRHLWAVSKLPRIFPSWEVLTHELKTNPLTPKWRAAGVAASDVQNTESKHPAEDCPALAIADECKQIGDEFRDSMDGMLKHPESRFFGIGTPGVPRGWFYRGFGTERHRYWTRRFPGNESPDPDVRALVAQKIEDGKADDPFFRQQWMAEFTGAEDGALMPQLQVEQAIRRAMPKSSTWKKIAALDVAGDSIGGTGDENVLTFRHGPVILKQINWSGRDEMETAAKTVGYLREFQPDIFVYDSVGIGAGVGSRIRELMKGTNTLVLKFNGGTSPRDKEQFANLKTEEAFYLRARFIAGEISIPDDPELVSQICSWTTKPTETGKTKLVDPADSPDKADSLLMAFAADRMGSSVVTMTPSFLR
jgi:hypothetical protein